MKPNRIRKIHRELYSKQQGICPLCYAKIFSLENDANLDHIKPKSKGGDGSFQNLQIVHIWCNQIKGNRDSLAPPELGKRIYEN